MTAGPGIVWPPKGVEPAAPATSRPGTRLQLWRASSGEPAQRVTHPRTAPQPPRGARLTAALTAAAEGMAALGHAAKQAGAAALPQLPAVETDHEEHP